MTTELIKKIQYLAEKYETSDFIKKDPSQFMHRFSQLQDVECVAFLSANLAFGRRDQILKHIQMILDECESKNESPSAWILAQHYKKFFTNGNKSFYRMYTDNDMILFFDTLKKMMEEKDSIGDYVRCKWLEKQNSPGKIYLHQVVAEIFPADCKLLPHSKDSAAKKVNMLLRWMVRDNSPVDLGLWKWFSKSDLLMPLDTHVLQESVKFGLLQAGASGAIPTGNLKTTLKLTESMKEAFFDDPVRGDFALFGLGVDN